MTWPPANVNDQKENPGEELSKKAHTTNLHEMHHHLNPFEGQGSKLFVNYSTTKLKMVTNHVPSSGARLFKCILACTLFMISCTNVNNKKEKTGEELSKTYCGSCHLFPDPALLDKRTWKEDVLPAMAKQLGIDYIYETTLPGQKPVVTVEEWKKILAYYINSAPGIMPAQERPAVKRSPLFLAAKKAALSKGNFPSTSFIKIDEGNHWIYAANSFDSSVNIYNAGLKLLSHSKVNAAVVDINFSNSLLQAGKRNGIFTNIGLMNPNDQNDRKC